MAAEFKFRALVEGILDMVLDLFDRRLGDQRTLRHALFQAIADFQPFRLFR